jgi:thiol-disulfide isomerase/thioredoxin
MSNAISDSGERHDLPQRSVPETSSKKVIWISSLAILFVLVFCAAFVGFYTRNDHNKAAKEPVNSGHALPAAELINESNQPLADSQLKNGKVVLVFITSECDACRKESEFLKGLVSKRADVRFYGVISYGDMESSLREAKQKFPFEVFYDRGFKLAGQLGINKVPIKIFVDNGIMKKSWGGATVDEKKKADFIQWLAEV